MRNLFIDLGANCGQSLSLYSRLFPLKSLSTVAFSVEASQSAYIQQSLNKQARALVDKFLCINIFNLAVSTDSVPLVFYDDMGEGSSALPYKYKYTLTRSLKGYLSYFKSKLAKPKYYSAASVLSFVPLNCNSISIDIKIDIEGSEYQVVNALYEQLPAKTFNNIFIEVHGHKAGKSLSDDIKVLNQARFLSSRVANWDATTSDAVEKVFTLYLMDILSLRLAHITKSFSLRLVKRITAPADRLLSRICSLVGVSTLPLSSSAEYSYIASQLSLGPHYSSCNPCSSASQSKLNANIDLTAGNAFDLLENVRKDAQHLFSVGGEGIIYKSAIYGNKSLYEHTSCAALQNELYRFVTDPLIACPSIIDLVISDSFAEVFSAFPQFRLAGVNLRRCYDRKLEGHTTGFHRDYNSFKTYKLFVPLASGKIPFLQYVDKSNVDVRLPHYAPDHVPARALPRSMQQMLIDLPSNIDSLPIFDTTALHREKPDFSGDVLILTFLTHPDYGRNQLKIKRCNIEALHLSAWAESFLSFSSLV